MFLLTDSSFREADLFSLNVNSVIDLDCDAPDLTHYFSQFSVLKSTIETTKP